MPKAVSLFLIRYDTLFAARNARFWRQSGHQTTSRECLLFGG